MEPWSPTTVWLLLLTAILPHTLRGLLFLNDQNFVITIGRRLLLDTRVVDVLRLFNLMLATLASLQSFLCNGLAKAWNFSDHSGAEDSGIQEERESFWTSIPMESMLDCDMADLRARVSAVASWGSGFLHAHPRLRRRSLLFSEVMMSL